MALIPVRSESRGAPKTNNYWVSASTTLYEGQLLEMGSNGTVIAHTDAATATRIIGVAAHNVTSQSYLQQVAVYDDPQQLFRVGLSTGTLTQTNVGNSASVVDNASALAGNSRLSKVSLDNGTTGTTASLALRIMGLGFNADSVFSSTPGLFTTSTTATQAIVCISPGQHWMNVNAFI